MTTPAGVPNLPIGALTVDTLAERLQDLSATAMRNRAGEQFPAIFNNSTGGNPLSDLTPFGILTNIWAGINSLIATSDPNDIQGPDDIPPLLLDFIEGLPFVGQFVQLLEAILGTYDGQDTTLNDIQDLVAPIVEFFTGVINSTGSIANWAAGLISGGLSTVMQTLETFLTGIPNLSTWLTTLGTWIDGLLNIGNLSTFLNTFKTFITGLLGIANFETWIATFKTLINGLLGITNFSTWVAGFKTLVDFFNGLVTSIGSSLWTVLTEVVNFFSGLFDGAGSVTDWLGSLGDNLLSVVGTILNTTVTSISDALYQLTGWRQNVPNLEGLIQGILGDWKNPITGTNKTLVDLRAWADKLLSATSVIPSFNLNGVIPAELLALIGVGNIGDVAPNLITDAGFGSAAALQAGVGWTWDATVNSTGSSGGAAKLLCDGGVKYMFSNLIAAAPGQQLTVSVKTRYTKGASAQANIIAAIRSYQGETVRGTDTVANLSATGTTSVGTTGADAAGFRTISGTYTVPANVDSVRLVLGVTTGPSGTTVWFDDASLAKTSKLPQDLVRGLSGTLSSLLPKTQFDNLLNAVADQTGATIEQVKDVLDGKLTSDSQLNGTNITIGNISAAVIEDLRLTWEQLGGSVTGGTGTAPTTIAGLAAEFSSLVTNITALSSLIGGNTSDIFRIANTVSGHVTLIAGLDSKLQSYSSAITTQFNKLSSDTTTSLGTVKTNYDALEKRVWNLENPTLSPKPIVTPPPIDVPPVVNPPTPPTPAPTPPTPVSVTDDFERATLGGSWSLTPLTSNGSTLGILNAHDAYMATPGTANTENRITAIYVGSGSASIGEYQKISATLGTKAGIPLVGTQGYNDLIGRAANANQCLFCRFYPDGRVRFGYRNGDSTDQFITGFFAPKPITGATPIEFYVGDKTVSDQTKLYAKVATATIGPAYVPANILASMGKRWGFAMGHGLSDGTFTFGYGVPQVPATMNFWAAQEQ